MPHRLPSDARRGSISLFVARPKLLAAVARLHCLPSLACAKPLPMAVITRFAPSPTGYLHIGSARTALFNWLYSRHHGGLFLLRIEDTDRQRSTEPAIAAIIDGLKWLGLDWDGDVVYQFARAQRHAEVARALVANGQAYYCYATPAELEAMRATARADDGRGARGREAGHSPQGATRG